MKRLFPPIALLICLCSSGFSQEQSATFEVQLPEDPGVWDAPLTSSLECEIYVNPLVVKWRVPSGGVTSSTGLLVVVPGKAPIFDCQRDFNVVDASWPDAKNLIVCNIFFRNNSFYPPYDFGEYQLTDVMRGLGKMLETYPQIDRRRLYLYGASGGGFLAYQVLQCSRDLWAEVHVHCAPIELGLFLLPPNQTPKPEEDLEKLLTTLVFPTTSDKMTAEERARYEAERALRSPRENMALDLPVAEEGAFPRMFVMHGTSDDGIPIDHFTRLRDQIQSQMGISSTAVPVTGGQRWNLRSWSFITIDNGDHLFHGGHSSVDSFHEAINHHVPDAFMSQRPTAPVMEANYIWPWRYGWRFRMQGTLSESTIETETANSADPAWGQMD